MKDKTFNAIAAELFAVSSVSRPIQSHAARIILAVSLFVACFLAANSAEAAPVIQLMTPQSGPVGTFVAIVGSGFGASQGASTVTFNGSPVTWVSWSATSLQVQVPAGATTGNVVVTVSGKASNTKSFTVTPSPVITGLLPTSGAVGATIAITGSNFTAGGTQSPQVVFNPELFASPISSTDTSITVAVPAGAVTGDLLVSVGGGNSNSVLFTVTSSDPSITSITPGAGVVGTSVTITGTNFGTSQGTSTVTFNGTTGTPTSWSPTSITVPVPTRATTGNVLVTVGGVASNPYGFEVGTAAPNITSISPTSGAVATSVTITGTGFGSTQGANTVNFNGVSGVPTSWSATQIKVPVPKGAATGSVVVTASGTVSNGVNFTVPGTGPSLTGLSPSSGPVGTSVTIAGTNFDATQGTSTVTFNGISATATGWSPTSIVATVPSGATSGSVMVSVNGTVSGGISFTVTPSITSLSPTSGAARTPVTITGTSFGASQGTSTVTFNGTTAIPTTWGASSITVPVPTGATTGNVVVTVSGVASNGVSFTVLPTPSITSLSPTSGAVGTSVTITGNNFGATQGTSTVTFNGVPGTPTGWSSTTIAVPVPTGTTSGNVVVTVGGVPSAGSNFTVVTPTSLSLTPTSASMTVGGSLQFTLTGTYSDGSTANAGSSATWSSSALNIATISGTGLATGVAVGRTTIQATVVGLTASANLGVSSQTQTGSLPSGVSGNTLTVLEDSTVLVAGGYGINGQSVNSAAIYNSSTGTFAAAGNLNTARANHTATLLNNGMVLIVGGIDNNGNTLQSAELYNPATGAFTTTGSLNTARSSHTATMLPSGTVLIAGGADSSGNSLNSAELYDPTNGTFTLTGSLNTARQGNTATLLGNGMILIAGGLDANGNILQSAELYNPATTVFSMTGNMTTPREVFTATLLNNGLVLMTGGIGSGQNSQASAELYNPIAGTFAVTANLNSPRSFFTATLLNNGTVLVTGGLDASGNVLATAELYDLVAATFTLTSNMIMPRYRDASVLLNNGNVLEVGGRDSNSIQLASAEEYQPDTLTPPGLISIAVSPVGPVVTAGLAQSFVATGTFSDNSTQTLASVTWSSSNQAEATISDDVTNSGTANPVAAGSVTISACTGPICGSTVLTIALPVSLPPSITSVSPTSASAGTLVTITGTNFGAAQSQGSSTVTFNGIDAVPTSWSNTQIVVPVPRGAATGPLNVVIGGTTLTALSQFGIAPSIASISTNAGPVGTAVTISGEGFGSSMATGAVILGSSPGTVTSWTDTQIIALVAPGSSSGLVQVRQGGYTSNSLNFTVSSPPALTSISPTSGPAGTQVAFTGSGFGSSQGNGVVLLGNTFGAITSWTDSQIVATVVPGAVTGTAQVIQGGFASNSYAFTVTTSTPSIASFTPGNGPAGTQVAITGSGFGSSQGSGRVLLGTTNGVVSGWSDSQIVATVASGSSSGTVQVIQSGTPSNSFPFTVNTPTVSSTSPNSGGAGTQITINGSGFGAVQGSGNVWLGTTYGIVVSWSDAQVVANVAAGSGSGYAQILQNGVWSNSVPFSSNTPNITSVSPSSGSPGTEITISGSGFGSSAGTLQLGTLAGIISTWSDSQIVATVASNSLTGLVQVQQNGLTSNALRFVVPTPGFGSGNSVTLTPSRLNLIASKTQQIQALNQAGSSVTGLAWSSSDTTVVSLSLDDPPVITAVGPGHATITAGDSSSDVTVFPDPVFLPVGTPSWTIPGDGSGIVRTIPAVPNDNEVDVFAVQASGQVLALTKDGLVVWQANVGTNSQLNADFLGGLVATNGTTLTKFDGATGQQDFQYTYNNPNGANTVSFGTDGTMFTIDGGSVVGIDGATGATKFSIPMTNSYSSRTLTCESQYTSAGSSPPSVGSSILAGDGYFYVSYQYTNSFSSDVPACGGSVGQQVTTQALLRVGPEVDSTAITLGSQAIASQSIYITTDQATGNYTIVSTQSEAGYPLQITSMTTNADQGIFATWSGGGTEAYCSSETYYSYGYHLNPLILGCVPATAAQTGTMTIGAGEITSQITGPTVFPVLQAQDGTYFGTTDTGVFGRFDQAGNTQWTAPNLAPTVATLDNGLIAQTNDGKYVNLDANGTAIGQVQAALLNAVSSWLPLASYLTNTDGTLSSQVTPILPYAGTFSAIPGGNQSGNGTPIQQVMTNQPQGPTKQLPAPGKSLRWNYNSIEILTSVPVSTIFSNYIQTYNGVRAANNDVVDVEIDNGNSSSVFQSGQILTFTLNSWLSAPLIFPYDPTLPGPPPVVQLQGPFSVLVERLDPSADTISGVTLKGHPLSGWRYWRVFSVGPNDVVVETGAADVPGPGPKNTIGFWLSWIEGSQLECWEEYMQYVLRDIQRNLDTNAKQGSNPVYNNVKGHWRGSPSLSYILNNVCQAAMCN
jgi:hypothetical protein